MEPNSKHLQSIRIALIKRILLLVGLLLALLFICNLLTLSFTINHVKGLNIRALSIYEENMQENLLNVDRQLYNLLLHDKALTVLRTNRNPNAQSLAIVRLCDTFDANIAAYSFLEGMYAYSYQNNICVSSGYTGPQRAIKHYAEQIQKIEDFSRRTWHIENIGGTFFLTGDILLEQIRVGVFISVEGYLRELMEQTQNQFSFLYLEDERGNIYGTAFDKENATDFIEARVQSADGHYALVGQIDRSVVFQELWLWWALIVSIMVLLTIVFIALLIRYLQDAIIRPIADMTDSMHKVSAGDLSIQIQPQGNILELSVLHVGFNKMMQQINHLKIMVYEERLHKQKSELRYLQLQSNPHYYLNSLNLLYGLALQGNIPQLKKMILSMSSYSRYMLKKIDAQVTLYEELAHIEEYVEFQRCRLNQEVRYTVAVEPDTLQCEIPALLLHTFVENSFKYGLNDDRVFCIFVTASRITVEGKYYLKLSEYDEGKGYSQQTLGALESGVPLVDSAGQEHFGIENIKQRMEFIYRKRMELRITNRKQGGALMEVLIPLKGEDNCETDAGG